MTKADYDELVRLNAIGYEWAVRTTGGVLWASFEKPKKIKGRFTVSANAIAKVVRNDILENVQPTDKNPLNIAAAIAEYEREQKEDA